MPPAPVPSNCYARLSYAEIPEPVQLSTRCCVGGVTMTHRLDAPFSPAPHALVEASAGRTGRGRLFLFLAIWKHAGPHDLAEVSMPTLAEECGLKLQTVQRDIAWLVKNGWILRLDFAGGRPSRYKVRCLQGRQRLLDDVGASSSQDPLKSVSWKRAVDPQEEREHSTPDLPEASSPPSSDDSQDKDKQEGEGDLKKRRATSSGPVAAGQSGVVTAVPPKRSRRSAEPVPLPPDAPALSDDDQLLLMAWWQRRCEKHPRADRLSLGRFTLNAIARAQQAGVLPEYLEKAREAAWMSLGHGGSNRLIEELHASATRSTEMENFPSHALAHTGSSMLVSGKPKSGHSGRRMQFLGDVLRLISPVDDSNGSNHS